MDYSGWAFNRDEKERRQIIADRHKIAEPILRGKIEMDKSPGYNHTRFTATVDESVLDQIDEMDVLIYADNGNLCFGGSCSRQGNTFSGSYNTD